MQLLLSSSVNQRALATLLTPFYFLFQSKKLLLRFAMLLMSVGMIVSATGQNVTTDKIDYAPGEIARISGTGWTQDTLVQIDIEENPIFDGGHTYSVKVKPDGTWDLLFPIEERHVGVKFSVYLLGLQSGSKAETYFTDAVNTQVGITSSLNPAGYGVPVTFTAGVTRTVPGNANTVVGTLKIFIDGIEEASFSITANNNINKTFLISNLSPGTHNIEAKFTGSESSPGYNDSENSLTQTINKTNSTITVTGSTSFTYNATPQGPGTSDVTGSTGAVTYSYSGTSNGGASYGPSATKPTLAGSYSVTASVAQDDNYNGKTSDAFAFTIDRAPSTIIVTGSTSFTYNASPQGPGTSDVTGSTGAVTYSYSGTSNGGASYGPSATKPTLAGSYSVTASVAQDDNYNGKTSDAFAFTIDKAPSVTTVTIVGGPFIYTGSPITPATVSVTGAGGVVLATPTATYANNVNAGTATASYTYAGDANHEGSTDSENFTIDKAPSVTTVTIVGGPFIYTGSPITPATVSVTGAGGVVLATPTATYANNVNAGTATASYTYAETANYLSSSDSKNFTIGKAPTTTTVTIVGGPFTYTGSAQTPATVSVTGAGGVVLATPTANYINNTNAGTATASYSYAGDANHESSSDSEDFIIGKRPITITAIATQKYCGLADPAFAANVTTGTIVNNDLASGLLTRSDVSNQSAGVYNILKGSYSYGNNYEETFVSASFTILGITVDASASSTPVPLGTAATLSATVSPAAAGITVIFTLDDGNGHIYSYSGSTDNSGKATAVTAANLPVEVYKITAVAGSGCATSIAYLPVYDPNGSFVTGGGWINSPAGALTADPLVVGKANFGFVSKYKKGSSTVEGNTEFQFNAGDINFKSTLHEAGSLVIAGAKATYRGAGTINGVPGYKFTLVAIDGNWNNGVAPDKFRIKITTTSGQVVYDNQRYDNGLSKDENADDATALGGGSIVIHEVKKKTANRMEPGVLVLAPQDFNVKVLGNPSLSTFRLQLQGSNMQEKFTVKVVDVNGRLIEVHQNLYAGQVVELGSKYTQGTYFAEVMQGANRKVVKLVKISRD